MAEINPRVDIAFKKIFGVEENKDLLISLINSIVSSDDQVKEITLLNPYNPQNFRSDKLSVLDIKAKGVDGKRFNIEIQITDHADYDKRALYYWAKLYTEQLSAGGDYSMLNKAIGIHILNFTSILESKKYHNVFHITEKDTGIRYFKELELHTIELTKFDCGIDDDFPKLLARMQDRIDIWSGFLTKYDLLKSRQAELPEEDNYLELKKALNIVNVMNFSDEERNAYDDHLKWLRDEKSALDKKFYEGRAEGEAKGRAEGEAKGRAELIRMMIAQGHSIDTIASITGLPIDEIVKLTSDKENG
jgi:predicted transposase/invertase (TIGR01784 family)